MLQCKPKCTTICFNFAQLLLLDQLYVSYVWPIIFHGEKALALGFGFAAEMMVPGRK